MTSFYDSIDAALDAAVGGDLALSHHVGLEFDFDGTTLRMWSGEGELVTPDGHNWYGWSVTNADGGLDQYLTVAEIADPRDGNSALLEYALGFLDDATWEYCRGNKVKVKGRDLTVWSLYLKPEDGLAASIPQGDPQILTMVDATFQSDRVKGEDGEIVVRKRASVLAKNINAGRSVTEYGAYSDTTQKARSKQLFDVDDDTYCQYVLMISNGYTITLD